MALYGGRKKDYMQLRKPIVVQFEGELRSWKLMASILIWEFSRLILEYLKHGAVLISAL